MRKHRSVLQNEQNCYICGSPYTEEHHALHGTANRKKADEHKLIFYLCHRHHMDLHDRAAELDDFLKQTAQQYWEENIGTRADFIKEFGRSYL